MLRLATSDAVDERGGDAELREAIDLVLHQGDERRDDERQPFAGDRRQLIAEAFAAAGGHDAEAILAVENRGNHVALAGPEGLELEASEVRFERRGGDDFHAGIVADVQVRTKRTRYVQMAVYGDKRDSLIATGSVLS